MPLGQWARGPAQAGHPAQGSVPAGLGLAVVILGSPECGGEESPSPASTWERSEPVPFSRAVLVPSLGPGRGVWPGQGWLWGCQIGFNPAPRILQSLRQELETGALQNWVRGEGPAFLKLQLQMDDIGIGLQNKTRAAFPSP